MDAVAGIEQASGNVDSDESIICAFLKLYHRQFVSGREICRRAGGRRRYRDEPGWALSVLKRLAEKGVLEADQTGHYRLIPLPEKEQKKRRWVSPQVRKILEQSGKTFDVISPEEDSGDVDQHYQ